MAFKRNLIVRPKNRVFVHVLFFVLLFAYCTWTCLDNANKKIRPRSITNREVNLDPWQIEGIKQNLWRKGNYEIMSLLLEKELPNIKLGEKSSITIFAPTDTGFCFEPGIDLRYQFVRAKVEEKDFKSGKIRTNTNFPTYYRDNNIVQVSGPRKRSPRVSINGVGITDWDLYNDGRVVVHGVDYFFDTRWIQQYRTRYIWDSSINATVEYEWLPDPELEHDSVSGPRYGGERALRLNTVTDRFRVWDLGFIVPTLPS